LNHLNTTWTPQDKKKTSTHPHSNKLLISRSVITHKRRIYQLKILIRSSNKLHKTTPTNLTALRIKINPIKLNQLEGDSQKNPKTLMKWVKYVAKRPRILKIQLEEESFRLLSYSFLKNLR
jgi:hypothetical protein